MLIYNVMRHEIVTCRVDDSLERAAQLMWERDLGFLPVVDPRGQLVGVITDRDALMAAYTRGTALASLRVETAMAREVVTCTIHDEVTAVEHRMAANRIRRVPVVNEAQEPIGIITLSDLARASLRGHEISPKGPTWALATITEPRQRTPS